MANNLKEKMSLDDLNGKKDSCSQLQCLVNVFVVKKLLPAEGHFCRNLKMKMIFFKEIIGG